MDNGTLLIIILAVTGTCYVFWIHYYMQKKAMMLSNAEDELSHKVNKYLKDYTFLITKAMMLSNAEDELSHKVNSYLKDYTLDCEICGCLVRKNMAVKGKAEIRNYANKTDCIFTPYYCKRCAPKEGKDKKK